MEFAADGGYTPVVIRGWAILTLATAIFAPSALGGPALLGLLASAALTSDYPEVVELKIGTDRCTGTLVGPEVVLTAAHCVYDRPAENPGIEVRGAGWNLKAVKTLMHPGADEAGREAAAKELDSLPEWVDCSAEQKRRIRTLAAKIEGWFASDLALVRLEAAADGEPRPVGPLAGAQATLVGFGATSRETGLGGGLKREGLVTMSGRWGGLILSGGRAADSPQNAAAPRDRTLARNSGLAWGDSGGPMLQDGRVVGVNVGFVTRDYSLAAAWREAFGPETTDEPELNLTADLSRPSNKAFLEGAAAKGFRLGPRARAAAAAP